MNLRFFIDRPVFSIVISVVIVLLGIISLAGLPVEQYPDIAPPTVQVTTSYPGANAETVQKAVIIPLEEAINGVENMSYIHSEASNTGDVTVNVYFRQGTDADMAAVNVQNRVSKAQGLLPAEVTKIGVQTQKQQKSLLKVVALYSPDDTYDMQFINNYMKINVEPRVKRIAGVGEFNVLASNYSMRIWLKPDVLAQYRLIPSDVTDALERQNLESATGSFGENHANTYEYTIKYRGRFSTPEEFGNIVIRSLGNGEILRLKDIARVELGDEAYTYRAMTDGHAGCIAEAYQSAGSNATEVVRNIDALIDEIGEELPEGLEFASLLSVNDFLFASIENVQWTLIEAILLVVLVVYVFLQDIRSTLIPTISIIVSLVGTFAFMAVAGFSINLLTLFALVLAIGTVVDNAIVVVEAVQAKFDAGYYSSYMATNEAMSGITAAIITSTLVFMAVFIPVSMMGGTSGVFYTQFGITMAVAVGLSAVNALTLSPADVLATVSGYYGGLYVSNFNRFSKLYRVMIQAEPDSRVSPESLNHIYVRTGNGGMAPVSQFARLAKTYGPQSLNRFNLYGSIAVNGSAADGYSSGDAIRAVGEVAASVLPKGYAYEFGGITREESQSGSNTAIIFAICFILVYLILSALYESFLIPLAVVLSLPFGLLGSFMFARLMGLENNIYMQTGLIMLIGLLAKTAILITEYAVNRRKAGMSLIQSAVGAAKVRLRPILMTALTMIFGLLPLMMSTGVGANGNRTLGSGAVGGMIVGTLALLFVVPALFIAVQWLQEKIRPVQAEPSRDWSIESEKEDLKKTKKEKRQ